MPWRLFSWEQKLGKVIDLGPRGLAALSLQALSLVTGRGLQPPTGVSAFTVSLRLKHSSLFRRLEKKRLLPTTSVHGLALPSLWMVPAMDLDKMHKAKCPREQKPRLLLSRVLGGRDGGTNEVSFRKREQKRWKGHLLGHLH